MKISYDDLTDTLYVFFDSQADTIARDMGNGLLLKYQKKNNKVVGAVVHDFESRFKMRQSSFVEIPANPASA
ncbi:MAG: DUF2283 domain-containing protein [Candidatus Omnitrophica bacterium]|nr:DUF2283 domain-containing protein [Candidatus Omnitrophota bacterium]